MLWFSSLFSSSSNLSCYQCVKPTEAECGLEDLKPCSSRYDRCAIHITKSKVTGLEVRRECGLAPCLFDDEMAAKGLGMNCDRSKEDYMCTSCCKGNGCNKNNQSVTRPSSFLLFLAIIFICIISVIRDFIPPYVMSDTDTNFKK
ncbi:uncharacterized protein LOC143200051 isoform X2 [Rhynchophorus ferrugineus]|uniref:uncharacterized protein LOC143200051 isoform X2 n=1 Tax=Rhynchophorus ferrugineus TaxID=354439 RepID=UPI003FCD793F